MEIRQCLRSKERLRATESKMESETESETKREHLLVNREKR